MSVDATVAVLYAQTGLATSMANAAAVAPQASAAMARVLAAEMARQEQRQVSKSEPGGKTSLEADGHAAGGEARFATRRRARTASEEEAEAAPVSFAQRQAELRDLDAKLEARAQDLRRLLEQAEGISRSPRFLREIILNGRKKGLSPRQIANNAGLSLDEVELILAQEAATV